jgi:hypothetical protein
MGENETKLIGYVLLIVGGLVMIFLVRRLNRRK